MTAVGDLLTLCGAGHTTGLDAKVDADYAADTVTRRSRTGFLVQLNCALIFWFS